MAKGVRRELVLVDWYWLHETGQLDEDTPLAVRIREAAPRIGMTADALEQALRRAGIRNPVDPSLNWRKERATEDRCIRCVRDQVTVDGAETGVFKAARRLARQPDSTLAKRGLAEAQGELERQLKHQDEHWDLEHAGLVA